MLDALRETLGKPDATVVDVKVELEDAAATRAVEAKKACGDVSTDTETRRCRSNADVKRAIREGLGKTNATDDEVLAVLKKGEASDSAERVSLCTDRACRERVRQDLQSSGAASDPNDAEVVVRTGQGRRSVDMLEACIEDSETSDDDTVKACRAQVLSDARAALGRPTSRRTLRRLQQLASMLKATRVANDGSSRASASATALCSETKRGKGESPSACVTESRLQTCPQDSRTDQHGQQRPRGGAGPVRSGCERRMRPLLIWTSKLQSGYQSTEAQKKQRRNQARADGQDVSDVDMKKLRERVKRGAGASAAADIARLR